MTKLHSKKCHACVGGNERGRDIERVTWIAGGSDEREDKAEKCSPKFIRDLLQLFFSCFQLRILWGGQCLSPLRILEGFHSHWPPPRELCRGITAWAQGWGLYTAERCWIGSFQILLPGVLQMACNGEFLCHLPKFLMLHYRSMLLQVCVANFHLD